ncbi:MAG: SsrA-binding protein [Chlamydiae bacterium]|nr:SsrA-binding protein [Chlamydiota bacterium]
MSKTNKGGDLVSNRKAFHHYEIFDTYEAGIVLVGSEVKSLKAGQGSLQDAYVIISGDEIILKNSSVAPYFQASIFNHPERRDRKLLLHKKEIEKLRRQTDEKGFALIPIAIYLKRGMVKVKIATAKGKKAHDKRAAIKEREDKRMIDRELKTHTPH